MVPEDRNTRTGVYIVSSLGVPSLMIVLQLLSGHLLPLRSRSLGSSMPPPATIFPPDVTMPQAAPPTAQTDFLPHCPALSQTALSQTHLFPFIVA